MLSFLNRIVQINIKKNLTSDMTQLLSAQLAQIKYFKIKLIAVIVDSKGGSIVQAKQIVNCISKYSQQKQAPIYCFAGAEVLNSANIILTSGNKVFASPYSKIGDFNLSATTLNLSKLQKDLDIQFVNLQQGKHKFRLNPFEELKEEDLQWQKELLNSFDNDLQNSIVNNRKSMNKECFNETLVAANDAKKLGLIDEISTLEETLEKEFKDIKIKQIFESKSNWQKELIDRVF